LLSRDVRNWEKTSQSASQNAENVARMIVNTYLAPNKTFPELRDMVNNGAIDPLRDFSEPCRDDFAEVWICIA
jgi:hypothetical protein